VDDESTLNELWNIKQVNKNRLASYILEHEGIKINPESIFSIYK